MNLQITCSGGGPLIAIPAELAAHWRGILPPVGMVVPKDWKWGESNEITCDYDRACFEMEDFVDNGTSGFGYLKVAETDGIALVLDMELMTTYLPYKNGGVIFRGFNDENITAKTAELLINKVANSSWKKYDQNINLKDGRIFIFDSAYQGFADVKKIKADDGVCIAQLSIGEYSIKYASINESSTDKNHNIEMVRFERVS